MGTTFYTESLLEAIKKEIETAKENGLSKIRVSYDNALKIPSFISRINDLGYEVIATELILIIVVQ
jgi:hypothetical protein